MDTPDDEVLLLAGSSVPVTDAIICAYARSRPCVVFGEALPDGDESSDG